MIEHIKALAEMGDPDEIERLQRIETPPDGSASAWSAFIDLHRCRGSSGFGPAALSYRDIDAWMRVTGERPLPWEVAAIVALDRAYLAHAAKHQHSPA